MALLKALQSKVTGTPVDQIDVKSGVSTLTETPFQKITKALPVAESSRSTAQQKQDLITERAAINSHKVYTPEKTAENRSRLQEIESELSTLPARDDYNPLMSVAGAVRKGLGMVAQGGADAFALAEDAVYAPFELVSGLKLGDLSDQGFFNQWADDIRRESESANQFFQENMERGGKPAELLETLGASAVAAIPQAALALATAGGSAAAQTAGGLSRAAASQLSPGVATTVRNTVQSMSKNPQFWTSFSQVVGSGYEDAIADQRARGETDENLIRAKAALFAIGNGLLNSAVEVGGGIETLPAQLQSGRSAWRSWVDSMVDEGKEEVVQGVIERALQNPIYQQGNPLFSTTDPNAILNPATAAQEFAGGAVVGGLLGGGQIALQRLARGNQQGGNAQTMPVASQEAAQETFSPLPTVDTSPAIEAQTAPADARESALLTENVRLPGAVTAEDTGVFSALEGVDELPRVLPVSDDGDTTSVGAAPEGFDQWSNFQNQRSQFFPEGANAARPVDVPTTDLEGRNIRKTASTAMGAKAIPDAVVQDIQNMVLAGKLSYDVNTDRASIDRAVQRIQADGFQRSLGDFSNAVQKGVVSKDLATLGQQLLVNAANAGDGKATAELLSLYAQMETIAGQAVQAASILRKLDPTYQLYAAQKAVDNLQNTLSKALKRKDITIDPALIEKFEQQTDQAGRDAVLDEIYQNIADQVPSTWKDKWNAWRYLAMLGNPRTHIRNIFGNVGFQPVRFTKDRIAAIIESAVSLASGGKLQRTKSFAYSPDLYAAAWNDYNNVAETLSGSKYDDVQSIINDRRTIFKTKPLEVARRANSNALSAEDAVFKRITYAGALSGYLNANGVTAEQLRSGQVDEKLLTAARNYAGQEALKATYNDKNWFSDKVVQAARGLGTFGEAVLPFKRTPANILARGFEYSPLGLAKGLTYDLAKVKSGEMTAAQAIDNIASGLTGSALLALGAYLAAQGMVTGGDDPDEKQQDMNDLTGQQSYSLNLPGGGSFTLDWLAPEALPFFMGVQLMNSMGENGLTAESITDAFSSISEPMLEMSMLQSLNDLIDNVTYAASNEKLTGLARSALISYLTQAIPTLGGQAERSSEDVRMSTYTDKTLPLPTNVQYALGKASARIPGWDYQQIPYIDAWGRQESSGALPVRVLNNFLNPGYTSTLNVTPVDEEVQRLYDQTGDGGVVPSRANRYITVNGEKMDLTGEQYVQYATQKGQTAYQIASSILDRQAYQSLSDEEKAEVISDVYSYADAMAKASLSDYQPSAWMTKITAAGIDPGTAILYRAKKSSLEDRDVEDINGEIRKLIMADNTMTASQKSALDKAILTDGFFLPKDTNVDYSDQEQFQITQLSTAAQNRWPKAKDWGMSAEEYAKYYPICAASGKKKEEILRDLVNAGMTENQANTFWNIVKN